MLRILFDEVPGVDHTTRVPGLVVLEQLGPLRDREDPRDQGLEVIGLERAKGLVNVEEEMGMEDGV